MKKGELIEIIQSYKTSGIITSDVLKNAHPIIVSKYIDMALNNIMFEIFKKNPEEVDIYGKWYNGVDIKSISGNYYCDLPCTKIQLPKNTPYIRSIVEQGNRDSSTFIYSKSTSRSVFSRLGTINRSGCITYSIEDKIYFDSNFDKNITKVDMFAITAFSDLSDNDEFPIPAGQDLNLIQLVLKFINGEQTDKKIDNE